MARFDKFMAEKNTAVQANGQPTPIKAEPTQSPLSNPVVSPPASEKSQKRESDDDELSDVPDTPSPKKKRKVDHYVDDDAAFAAKLQAEENSRARSTRNGMNRKTVLIKKKKKNPRKKTSNKVKAEDDSDLQDSYSEVTEKKINRSGGFHVRKFPAFAIVGLRLNDVQKPMTLSGPLSALLDNEIQVS